MQDISRKAILWTLAGVVLLWALTPLITYLLPLKDMGERGQVGDLFGSVNALFSGLAFAGVVFAILLQRQELSLQRQELKETRLEMKRTADAQEAAHQALNKTIWAQSYKMALEMLEESAMVGARRVVASSRNEIEGTSPEKWSIPVRECVEKVSRSFEMIGSMIRKGLLPGDYITDTWSVVIDRNWRIMEKYITTLRSERNDPFIGIEFEELTIAARAFLEYKDAALEQRMKRRAESNRTRPG